MSDEPRGWFQRRVRSRDFWMSQAPGSDTSSATKPGTINAHPAAVTTPTASRAKPTAPSTSRTTSLMSGGSDGSSHRRRYQGIPTGHTDPRKHSPPVRAAHVGPLEKVSSVSNEISANAERRMPDDRRTA